MTRGPTPIYTDIEVRGTVYPDASACAKALGVGRRSVLAAIRNGKLDSLGLGRGTKSSMPIMVRGKVYANVHDCAKALKLTPGAVYRAVERGTTDRLGLRRTFEGKRPDPKTFTIGGVTFPSLRAASAALGFHHDHISLIMRRPGGPTERQQQTLLAAAMRYVMQREAA